MARTAYRRGRVRPRGACPLCGKNVALLGDGRVAMRHRAPNGNPCSGHGEQVGDVPFLAPEPQGLCAVCSAEVKVMVNGHPRPHKARRMRMGAGGQPEAYLAEDCAGLLQPAEPLEVTP